MERRFLTGLAILVCASVAAADPGPVPPVVAGSPPAFMQLTTLRLLRERNLITETDYEHALTDIGSKAAASPTLLLGRWMTTLYGFIQADVMWHSTQSFPDYGSNLQVARPDTLAGQRGRTSFSIRDTRFGFRIAPPVWAAFAPAPTSRWTSSARREPSAAESPRPRTS